MSAPTPGDRFARPPEAAPRPTGAVHLPGGAAAFPGGVPVVPGAAIFPGTEQVDPARVFATPGYTSPPPPTNAMAQVALWLSVPLLFAGPFLLVSAILGAVSLARSSGMHGAGRRAAAGALAISVVGLVLWGLLWLVLGTG